MLAAAGVQAAIGRYRQLKAEDPQAYDFSATALIEYAAALIDEQQQGAAVTILEMAAEEFPDAPGVFAALGNALVAENDLPAALAAYRRALTLQPDRRMRRSLQAAIDRLQHR